MTEGFTAFRGFLTTPCSFDLISTQSLRGRVVLTYFAGVASCINTPGSKRMGGREKKKKKTTQLGPPRPVFSSLICSFFFFFETSYLSHPAFRSGQESYGERKDPEILALAQSSHLRQFISLLFCLMCLPAAPFAILM